jgi:hypothetical protein
MPLQVRMQRFVSGEHQGATCQQGKCDNMPIVRLAGSGSRKFLLSATNVIIRNAV